MMGPNNSGRIAANIITAQPAWQFPITQEADEITGMPRFERNADLTVGLEPANARAVAGAGVDDDEWSPRRIDLDARRRNHAREHIIDRTFELSAVHDELDFVFQYVRCGLGNVLAILVAALAHHVPEQDA